MKQFFAALTDRAPAPAAPSRSLKRLSALVLACAWLALLPAAARAQQVELPRVGHAAAPVAPSVPANQTDRASLPSRRHGIDFQPGAVAHVLEPLAADEAKGLAPNQIGVGRAVGLQPAEAGTRFANPDGTAVHVLVITSPGARGLRLHFENFDLPEGDAVYVYGTEDEDYVSGPFGGRGPQSAGEFWSGTVAGETAVVEYHTRGDAAPLLVSELSHMLSDPQAAEPPALANTLPCELDGSCYSDVEKNAVARMYYIKNGGAYVCTGTLMNTTNASFIPYFMTANHCISTQTAASTLETYWFYQTSSCNSGLLRSGGVRRSGGAQLLATSQSADATLLRLYDSAPAGTVFSGWDANERPVNDPVFGLHHPGTDIPPGTDSYLRRSSGPILGTESCPATGLVGGYYVDWTQGLTEPGSSGSGLWYTNGGNHYYVGTLSCGPANPDCVTTFSLYGKFSAFYSSVSGYLAPPPQTAGLQYFPLPAPVRLLDTRPGASACDAPGAALTGGVARSEAARTTCTGIPATALAVVGNATVVNNTGAAAGFATLYPSGASRPNVSNLNYVTGQVVPNAFTVALGSNGAFNVYAQTGVHFIVDVTGYFAPPAAGGRYFHPLPSPVRLLDTRPGQAACQNPGAQLAGGTPRTQAARMTCGGVTIPSTAQAVVGNATVINAPSGGTGFVTLYPSGTTRPNSSNLNYVPGNVIPNAFTVALGSDGAFSIFPQTSVDFIVDIVGYFSDQLTDVNGTGLLYTPLTSPVRLLDTRSGQTACDTPGSPLTGGVARTEAARIACTGIPTAARSVVGNATVVNNTGAAAGFVTLYPSGASRPNSSNLNYVTGQVVPNAFTVGLGGDGAFNIFAQTGINFIADVTGYYAP